MERPLSEVFEKYEVNREEYQYYLKANNVEERLSEYRDSEEGILAKVILLAAINKSREKYDASPVKLDILASRVANKNGRRGCFKQLHRPLEYER